MTTIVVLSRPATWASSSWVSSPFSARISTPNIRGVSPISCSASAIRVASTWLAWASRKLMSGTVRWTPFAAMA